MKATAVLAMAIVVLSRRTIAALYLPQRLIRCRHHASSSRQSAITDRDGRIIRTHRTNEWGSDEADGGNGQPSKDLNAYDNSNAPPPSFPSSFNRGNDDWKRNDHKADWNNRNHDNSRRPRFSDRSRPPPPPQAFGNNNKKDMEERKINMRALEGAGFVHLYGLSSIVNALEANRRDFTRVEDLIDMNLLDEEAKRHEEQQRRRKPEAQFSPYLFVQEVKVGGTRSGRSSDKHAQAERVLELAEQHQLPIAYVDKGILNALSGNRPHQGYVLRCGALEFDSLSTVPPPRDNDPTSPKLWLVLDEIVDPQNLGALLRSVYFFGGRQIGVLVCAKNSAPLSPIVSAASAGALERLQIYSTNNLPRTLAAAESDGFAILGASAHVPNNNNNNDMMDLPPQLYDLHDLPELSPEQPLLLVLGSEGQGLRTMVARSCTQFVRIPGSAFGDGVDSLNVSVTGGILLCHLAKIFVVSKKETLRRAHM